MSEQWIGLYQHIIPQIEVLLIVIFIDFVLGVSAAIKNHEFDVKKLPNWLEFYGLRALGWLGLEMLAVIPEEYLLPAGITDAIGDGALALIILSALGSILKSAREIGIMPKTQKPYHEGDVA